MAASTIPINVSALHEILKWSSTRPEWQRDALRRIIVEETIEAADIEQLDLICRDQRSALKQGEKAPKPDPLAASHLPPAPGDASSVVLISLGNLQHVNRLPSNQTITFGAAPGLSIIYGDNGSGKSGYARVLKKSCRSRGAPPVIKPNAYKPKPAAPATATITCQIGGASKAVVWTDGQVADSILSNIFTFDGNCAAHYIMEDGPACFTPHGLDILPKLSQLCDRVRDRLQHDIATEKAVVDATAANWKTTATTPVGVLIGALSTSTKTSDIDNLAIFAEADKVRLQELTETLKSNPKQKAKETRAVAERLRAAAATFEASHKALADDSIDTLRKLIEEVVSSEAAAKAFSKSQFDQTFLAGTGGDSWRTLWEAAESYSSEPYDGIAFPNTAEEARCLLCQRPLDDESTKRFEAFHAFCKDQSQQRAAASKAKLATAGATIDALKPLAVEITKIEADLDGIADPDQAAIKSYAENVDARLSSCKTAITTLKWSQLAQLPAACHPVLSARAAALDARAVTEESADDPVTRGKLLAERDALTDREWLVGAKSDVLKQLTRLHQIALLQKCQKDTATNSITTKSSELTKQIVTDAFCQQFEDEIKGLGLRTITVEMQGIKGHKGETRFGLRLKGADGDSVHEIASEGEQRCIGLAAFLAELSQASHKSALVFDDPVSSLDHWHHQKIAERLATEAKTRQVIVFTHSTSFLHDLQQAGNAVDIEPHILHLEWNGGMPGLCREGLPWDWKTAKDRFDKLEKRQREIAAAWNPQPNEQNIQDMRQAYSWLRATIERIVEKEVFADVVFRFRVYIKVQFLDGVVGFTTQECSEIQRLMQKCHDVTEAHDPAAGKHAVVPNPTDFLKDIADTRAVVDFIHTRRKAPVAATPPVTSKSTATSR